MDERHPLARVYAAAILQATQGKGQRHGGEAEPFYQQQWVTLARCHGSGFLTGQAAKKLNETAAKSDREARIRELLGAIVYAGMAVLMEMGLPEGEALDVEEMHRDDNGRLFPGRDLLRNHNNNDG